MFSRSEREIVRPEEPIPLSRFAILVYLVETFRAELATSVTAALLSLSTDVFLCCTMRIPPAFTENKKKTTKSIRSRRRRESHRTTGFGGEEGGVAKGLNGSAPWGKPRGNLLRRGHRRWPPSAR